MTTFSTNWRASVSIAMGSSYLSGIPFPLAGEGSGERVRSPMPLSLRLYPSTLGMTSEANRSMYSMASRKSVVRGPTDMWSNPTSW